MLARGSTGVVGGGIAGSCHACYVAPPSACYRRCPCSRRALMPPCQHRPAGHGQIMPASHARCARCCSTSRRSRAGVDRRGLHDLSAQRGCTEEGLPMGFAAFGRGRGETARHYGLHRPPATSFGQIASDLDKHADFAIWAPRRRRPFSRRSRLEPDIGSVSWAATFAANGMRTMETQRAGRELTPALRG